MRSTGKKLAEVFCHISDAYSEDPALDTLYESALEFLSNDPAWNAQVLGVAEIIWAAGFRPDEADRSAEFETLLGAHQMRLAQAGDRAAAAAEDASSSGGTVDGGSVKVDRSIAFR